MKANSDYYYDHHYHEKGEWSNNIWSWHNFHSENPYKQKSVELNFSWMKNEKFKLKIPMRNHERQKNKNCERMAQNAILKEKEEELKNLFCCASQNTFNVHVAWLKSNNIPKVLNIFIHSLHSFAPKGNISFLAVKIIGSVDDLNMKTFI